MSQAPAPAATFSARVHQPAHASRPRPVRGRRRCSTPSGRAVCEAGCLPRKELFEAWEMARRVRRRFRGGRIVDLAGGHGLLAQVLLLLDDSSPSALVVDPALPPSAARAARVARRGLAAPARSGRLRRPSDLDDRAARRRRSGRVVSRVRRVSPIACSIARRGRARSVAVLPCCHDARDGAIADARGWMDRGAGASMSRARTGCAAQGYQVWTQSHPARHHAEEPAAAGATRTNAALSGNRLTPVRDTRR